MSSYNRDAAVQALKALYETVMLMGDIPTSTLATPPDGWRPPASTRKSAEVVDIMAHLPYSSHVHLAHETAPVNYLIPNWPGTFVPFKPYGDSEADNPGSDGNGGGVADVSKHEMALTMQNDNSGAIMMLDVESGESRPTSDFSASTLDDKLADLTRYRTINYRYDQPARMLSTQQQRQ